MHDRNLIRPLTARSYPLSLAGSDSDQLRSMIALSRDGPYRVTSVQQICLISLVTGHIVCIGAIRHVLRALLN